MAREFRTHEERLAVQAKKLATRKTTLAAAIDVARVNEWIVSVCEDPTRAAEFRANPDDTLAAAGIKGPLAGLIKSGYEYFALHGGVLNTANAQDSEAITVLVVVVVVVVAAAAADTRVSSE